MKIVKNEYMSSSGSFLEILKIAFPLICAASSQAVNLYVDRAMLSHYSHEALGASFTGGLTNFTIVCIFLGLVGYTGTFVAQYAGANQPKRIGTCGWQGLFLALAGGAFMATGLLWAEPLFELFGHEKSVMEQEIIYFKILCIGCVFYLMQIALSCFWSGRGKTMIVMGVSLGTMVLNIPFNYMLIFGRWGFPEMGIAGAAWGSILASFGGLLFYIAGFFTPSARRHFNTGSNLFDWELFRRMIRFGLPAGVQLFLDLAAFNLFAIILCRYSKDIQGAVSIAFGVNSLSFTPITGIGQTVAIMVGQAIGARNIPLAEKSVKSAMFLTILYTGTMAILFFFFPAFVVAPFVNTADANQAETIRLTAPMLKFVAGFLVFDGICVLLFNALRGAGDTKFAMWATILMAWGILGIPCVILYNLGYSVWVLWGYFVLYVMIFAGVFFARYLSKKWTKMRVIEEDL